MVTVSSQLFLSLHSLHNCQLTVLVHPLPTSPGRRITPGCILLNHRKCLIIRRLDIILHLLCKQAAEVGSLHNKIMLTSSVSPSNHRYPLPGRHPGRKGTGFSGRSVTGPLPAPHRAEESGPQFPQFLYTGATPHQHQEVKTPSSPVSRKSSCWGVQHSCGSPSRQRSCVSKNCHTTFAVRSPR